MSLGFKVTTTSPTTLYYCVYQGKNGDLLRGRVPEFVENVNILHLTK